MTLAFFFFSVVLYDNGYFDGINQAIFNHDASLKNNVLKMMDWVYANCNRPVDVSKAPWYVIKEDLLPCHISARSVIEYGYGIPGHPSFGPCGSLSRVAIVLLRRNGIPVRKLQLLGPRGGHTTVTVMIDGKWRGFDPSFHAHWINDQNEIATLEEIKEKPHIFERVYERIPEYPYRFDETAYIRWAKLGKPGLWLATILRGLVGEKRFQEIDTPYIYEKPRLLYGIIFAFLAIAFFGVYEVQADE